MYLDISDGTTTVVLSGTSPVTGCTFFPKTSQYKNGDWQPVTEDAIVNLRGTHTAIRSTTNSVEGLIQAAIRRQETGVGPRVYVNYKPVDSDSSTYRSEIIDGRVNWSTEPGLRRLGDTNPPAQVQIIWTRQAGWDGAEAELSVSSNGQSAATGGRTITNNPAGANWLQAAAAQVGGVLPTPVRIELTNSTGSGQAYRKLVVNVNAYSDPANLVYYLQGEARISGGSTSSDATCSGSSRLDFTATSSITTFQWTLPAADMQRTDGRRARLVARMNSITGILFVRPKILDGAGNQVLWQGDELSLGTLSDATLWDLGIVPLPPGGYGGSYGALRLGLDVRGASTSSLDVLQLSMIDAYRFYELPSVSVANNATIVLDSMEGRNYISTSGAWTPLPVAFGEPIMVQPNTLQRLHFLYEIAATNGVPITGTFSGRVYYRPRRLTV